MNKMTIAGLVAVTSSGSLAFADPIKHSDICQGGIVQKELLAKAIIFQNTDATKIFLMTKEDSNKWRKIYTENPTTFCAGNRACLGPPAGKPNAPLDNSVAIKTLGELQFQFANWIQTNSDGRYYRIADPNIGTAYLSSDKFQIACVGAEIPNAPKPTVLKLPIRVRANADDLNIDAARDKDKFKALKPATLSVTRDAIQNQNTAKLQVALGYAIPLAIDVTKSDTFTFFVGEVVPYVSANQSYSKVDHKPGVYADTNNIAVGALLNSQALVGSVNNVISTKLQYLWNTKDKSEIASLKFIYAPWTLGPVWLNTPQQIGLFPEATWMTLLFDLRNNSGNYTNKGDDPNKIAAHKSFDRVGTRFGLSIATNDQGPHWVLNVTNTFLYGYVGSIKYLNLFDSNLSYYFDSTGNFGITAGYTNGRNEDTAELAQTFTIGLSAKF